MKTDELFYELFKLDPRSLFRLVHLDLEGEYTFESLTVKTTEKRFDGLCRRIDGIGPNVFLEIQGYPDAAIYWRLFREICTYHEQTRSPVPFIAVVLFLDAKDDPGNCQLSCVPPNQLIRANLINCLKTVWENAGVLTILKPLVIPQKEEIVREVQEWKTELRSLGFPDRQMETLIGLLEYVILQRFPGMTRKEIDTMLQLTPLEKTVAGQELIQIGKIEGIKEGIKEGQKEGIKKGELIGEIRMAQRILKRPVSSRTELAEKSLKELKTLFQQLEAELN
jgi:predicted transposase YdaD